MATDILRLELAREDATELASLFDEKPIEYSSSVSKQLTGQQLLLSIIVPATLAAIQIVAAYLSAKKPQSNQPQITTHTEVNQRYIKTEDFHVETVEEIIEHHLE